MTNMQATGSADGFDLETGASTVVPPGSDLYNRVLSFYYSESQMIDDGELEAWTKLLHPHLRYRMPVRVTRRRNAETSFAKGMGHFWDTYESICLRVRRLTDTKKAWAEDPPSRTRHFVTNLRVREDATGNVHVRSNLLLTRSRWDDTSYELISAERRDVLATGSGALGFLLLRRNILVDQTTLGTVNLAIFL
jgi:3-phenylpropionate/cinnamic acid dioxygenase small subunit